MIQPLVSVIIPLFNSQKFISETLRSIYDQSYPNIEVIVIDDGSTDFSYRLVSTAKNDRTVLLRQRNSGASAARNLGLLHARGKYIQFIDADDLLSADKIAAQVKLLEEREGQLAVCSTVHFPDGTDHITRTPSPYEESFLLNDNDPVHFLINLMGGFSENGSMIPIHSWLVPKKVIDLAGKWDESLSMDDDGEYFCRVILHSTGIVKTDGVCYYRRSAINHSLSSQTDLRSYQSMLKSYTLRKNHLLRRTNDRAAKIAVYKLFMNLAGGSYVNYPEIAESAIQQAPDVYIPGYLPSVGGPLSTNLAKIFGWRTIKKLQRLYHSIASVEK